MSERIRTIRLYGQLGSKFGRTHKLAVRSPREAVRALAILYPGFERYMMEAKDKGLGFSVFVGKQNLAEEELEMPPGEEDIRIAPVLLGSKRAGLFQIVLGAVILVGAAIATGGGALAWGAALSSGGMTGAIAMAGVSMMLGGVAQMLAPTPKGLGAKDGPNNQSSYSFNGPINTQAQGNPVPVLYGRLTVGSAVISAGITAQDAYAPYDPCWKWNPDKMSSWIGKNIAEAACRALTDEYESERDRLLSNADPHTGRVSSASSGGGGAIKWNNDEFTQVQ